LVNGYKKSTGFSARDKGPNPIRFLEANPFVKMQVEKQFIQTRLVGS
jgi:hypothetical protein